MQTQLTYIDADGQKLLYAAAGFAIDADGRIFALSPEGKREDLLRPSEPNALPGQLCTLNPETAEKGLSEYPRFMAASNGDLHACLSGKVIGNSDLGFGFFRFESENFFHLMSGKGRQNIATYVTGRWAEMGVGGIGGNELLIGTPAFFDRELVPSPAVKIVPGRRGRRSPLAGRLAGALRLRGADVTP